MYLEGLSDEEDIPFRISRDVSAQQQEAPARRGPAVREGVDAGTDVIDLAAMKAELEANPEARRRR